MTINLIIACDSNYGVGKDNKIPWNCPQDMKRFKELTNGSICIMGRNTYESILQYTNGNGLKNRVHYVITRQDDLDNLIEKSKKVKYYNIWKDPLIALKHAIETSKNNKNCDIYIIGGASIYQQLIPYCECLHISLMDKEYDCDTFFDPFDYLKRENNIGQALIFDDHVFMKIMNIDYLNLQEQ